MKIPYNECGSGWDKLINPLIELCQTHNVEIFQIKEKFGGLRFYVDSAPRGRTFRQRFPRRRPQAIHKAIAAAEAASFKVCEVCGEPGKAIINNNWVKTVCEQHK